jgi:hypothetical protein
MTKPQSRQELPFAGIIIETLVDPRGGATYGLYANERAKLAKKPVFSGHIEKGMGDQLRLVAAQFDFLEKKM